MSSMTGGHVESHPYLVRKITDIILKKP